MLQTTEMEERFAKVDLELEESDRRWREAHQKVKDEFPLEGRTFLPYEKLITELIFARTNVQEFKDTEYLMFYQKEVILLEAALKAMSKKSFKFVVEDKIV